MGEVREPKKINSIDKKKRIIEAGLKIFGEKGYYNTNTAEIAKVAGVSTGIVYSYFKDKNDIFLQSINLYFDNISSKIVNFMRSETNFKDLENSIKSLINVFIDSHKENFTAHEEMIALCHLNKEVHNEFMKNEIFITDEFVKYLKNFDLIDDNLNEKAHLAYNLIENICHEFVYHKHSSLNNEFLINETIKTIKFMLADKKN